MRKQWGLSPFSIDRLRAGANVTADGFTLWLENGQLLSHRTLPSEPDWFPDWLPAVESDPQVEPDTIDPNDERWPALVMDCYELFNDCGFMACHHWISAQPNPYRCELWRVLDKIDRADRLEVEGHFFDELMSEVECD
ncbi:hypothetical protein D3C80_1197230 [compost metagenome]